MTDTPKLEAVAAAPDVSPRYHAPVMVEYGSARNLTRTNNQAFQPDGLPIDDGLGSDDGGGPAS